jgi:hypothetical protein
MPRKPRDYKAERERQQAKRLAEGYTKQQIRRGIHATRGAEKISEGHGTFQKVKAEPPSEKFKHGRREQFRAGGERTKDKRGVFDSDEPPTVADVRAAIQQTSTENILMSVGGYFDETELKQVGSPRFHGEKHREEEEEEEREPSHRYVGGTYRRADLLRVFSGRGSPGVANRLRAFHPDLFFPLLEVSEVTFSNTK